MRAAYAHEVEQYTTLAKIIFTFHFCHSALEHRALPGYLMHQCVAWVVRIITTM